MTKIETVQGTKYDIMHVVDECQGSYSPQVFCDKFEFEDFSDINREDWDIVLEGPEGDHYLDAWANIKYRATAVFDPSAFSLYGGKHNDGKRMMRYFIYQDCGIFLVPENVCPGCSEEDCTSCNSSDES